MTKTIIVLFILFSVPIFSFVIYTNNISHKVHSNLNNDTQNQDANIEFAYDFVYPKKNINKREIIGEFVSNDIASIYSRREAIIKDILVDIGDEVKTGQVLATLFDVGVSGQAQSNISEKNEILKSKQIELQNIKNLEDQKINELNEKINEQYKLLEFAKNNKDVRVNQIQNLLTNTSLIEDNSIILKKQAVEVEQKSLELLEKNLEDALYSKESKLKDLENKKQQILDNSLVVIEKSFDNIIKLIYLGKNRSFSNNDFLNSNDIPIYLSAKDTNLKNTFLKKVEEFNNIKINSGNITELFNKLEEIYFLAPNFIDNTVLSSDITQNLLDSLKNSIFATNSSLIKQRGDLENIINNYEITNRNETEKINSIKNNISKQKEVLILKQKELELGLNNQNKINTNLEDELEKIRTSELNTVETIGARIKVLEQNLNLAISQKQKNIDDVQNAINIARSSLNTTVSIYGNNQIISPFDGIISKRNINVGDLVSSSMLAFEMIGVNTSLSQKATQEVIFNIPQELKNYVEKGNEIEFVGVNDSTNIFTGLIWRISPQIDQLNNTIQIQAKVDENFLPHNSNVRVFLNIDKNYLTIPFSSVYNRNGEKVVYFLRESGNLGYRKVNIINEVGEMVDIEGFNLDESYKIVTTPLYFE